MSILHSRHWIPRLVIAGIGLLLAEGFLNLTLSGTIERSLWFTGGIHEPDPTYAFRFAPNYRGWQRHRDGLYLEPLVLDEHGHRRPAMGDASLGEVVLIGGYSMTFSYGVPDSMTIHHALARSLRGSRTVRNTAWPGFDVHRNFHLYKDARPTLGKPDLAVVLFFQDALVNFADLPVEQEAFVETKPRPDLFTYFPNHAVAPAEGIFRQALGPLYMKSLVLHSAADQVQNGVQRLPMLRSLLKGESVAVSEESGGQRKQLGAERLRRFGAHVVDHFGGNGHVLFVVLPGHQQQEEVDELLAALPPGSNKLDLNRVLDPAVDSLGTMAWGHYSPRSSELIGRTIAQEVNKLLER